MSKILDILKAPIVFLLRRPVLWFAKKVASSPDRQMVFERLSEIYQDIISNPESKHGSLYKLDFKDNNFIIFSDLHKGNRGRRDEFKAAEKNYLAALEHYDKNGTNYINLGDSEEFWKFNIFQIMQHNKKTFEAERKFVDRKAFYKVYGNHDLFWKIDPFSNMFLWQVYGKAINIYGAIVIRVAYEDGKNIDVFCTHGHQGDRRSDGNNFSIWFVSYIWGPLQGFLGININTPAVVNAEKTLHNRLMYDWSQEQQNVVLVTGHTHQPIFHSYSHIQYLKGLLIEAKEKGDKKLEKELTQKIERHPSQCTEEVNGLPRYKPTYFNAGCGCYADGSLTGIEIKEGKFRLICWNEDESGKPQREVLEELPLEELQQMFFDQ
ncbi:metallophosphoesterase [Mongoliibacter ruber]|uniref:Calcineurin-like phosphoesterase family protein n=1 Tax=Mongoliibacter ruber TaxID=1750599 RepID=A0A2T0WSW6_9BACT|nr:metallophosphoesterase [Mongoliibacter ruber]PRY89786.1 calcineurin-like phosphoesterase family protein [Mongoliibacter ruber]